MFLYYIGHNIYERNFGVKSIKYLTCSESVPAAVVYAIIIILLLTLSLYTYAMTDI